MGFIALFGQVFCNGAFTTSTTMTGISGFLVAGLGALRTKRHRVFDILVILCCVTGLSGIGVDAYHYYMYVACPGNDFGWFLKVPFCGAFIICGWVALRQLCCRAQEIRVA